MPLSMFSRLRFAFVVTFGLTVVLGLWLAAPAVAQLRPDLRVTALPDPPSTGLPGDSFVVAATVLNSGAASSPATMTKFWLVSTTGPTRKNLKGVQLVPTLGVGLSDSTPVTLSIYSDTVPGIYFFQGCADGGGIATESNEGNNCRTTTATITVQDVPDIVVTNVSNPPTSAPQGGSFQASATIQNTGAVNAAASTAKFFFVSVANGTRKDLKGTLAVPQLGTGAGGTFTDAVTVTVRPETAPGQYRLQCCADSAKVVVEDSDDNNCFTSTGIITVTPTPDLVVSSVAVAGAPLSVGPGGTLDISATVANQGAAAAAGSTMKYVLVNVANATQKNLKGTLAVGGLAQGQSVPTQKTVTVYADTAFGTYTVQTCIDSLKAVVEGSESNNCTTAPGTVTVQDMSAFQPDLVVIALTNPPSTIQPGASFQVTATVKNQGGVGIAASNSDFYLVNTVGGTRKNLKGLQAVGPLAAGAQAAPPTTVKVYSDTAPGTYTLEACANDGEVLAEANTGNNCRQTTATVTVLQVPDLVVTALSNPPAQIGQGQSFTVTDSVQNIGPVGAGASNTKYYFVPVAGGTRLNLKGLQDVPALPAGSPPHNDTLQVTVKPETPVGTYRLQACADSAKVIFEQGEGDLNCRTSTGTAQVTGVPDLVVTSVTVPGAAITPLVVGKSTSFSVNSTVQNIGAAAAGATSTRFSLIPAGLAGLAKNLQGLQAVNGLAANGGSQSSPTVVTVPATTLSGLYVIQACADIAKLVAELLESNNCLTSTHQVQVQ